MGLFSRNKQKEEKKDNSSNTRVYHVSKRRFDSKWTIKYAGGSKVIKLCNTQEEALAFANALAKSHNGTVLVHASKGKNKGKIRKTGW